MLTRMKKQFLIYKIIFMREILFKIIDNIDAHVVIEKLLDVRDAEPMRSEALRKLLKEEIMKQLINNQIQTI